MQTDPDKPTIGFEHVKAFVKRLGPAGPLALVAASVPAILGLTVLGSLYWVGGWMQTHQGPGAFLYFVCFAVLGGVGLMPTHAYSALGGYAFGFEAGFALAMASYLAAAIIAYPIARLASGSRIVDMISEHRKASAVYQALLGSGRGRTLLITFLVRLTSSPFAITNLLMAATRVHPVTYIVATLVGMAPRTGALVFIASVWGLKQGPPVWLTVIFTAVTLIVLGVIGYVANRAIERVTRPGHTGDGG